MTNNKNVLWFLLSVFVVVALGIYGQIRLNNLTNKMSSEEKRSIAQMETLFFQAKKGDLILLKGGKVNLILNPYPEIFIVETPGGSSTRVEKLWYYRKIEKVVVSGDPAYREYAVKFLTQTQNSPQK